VYASNYPPVATYTPLKAIKFTGTPPFDLVLSPGSSVSVKEVYELQGEQKLTSFTDKTGAPGIITCIPMSWYDVAVDFPVFSVPVGQQVAFAVSTRPSIPGVVTYKYKWLAKGFDPETDDGESFVTKAPADPGAYPVTLTAQSEGYCDLQVMHTVPVVDCHGGWLDTGMGCVGNDGGRIGNND
jgi:hypothetical protein